MKEEAEVMIGRVAGGALGEVGRDTQNSRTSAKIWIATNHFGTQIPMVMWFGP